jgi:hypothetical protein
MPRLIAAAASASPSPPYEANLRLGMGGWLPWLDGIASASTGVNATAGLVVVTLMDGVTWDVDTGFLAWPFDLAPVALSPWHMP